MKCKSYGFLVPRVVSCLLCLIVPFVFMHITYAGSEFNLTIRGVLEDAPECVINGNNKIDVDFGDDVYISKIDGVNYKKTQLIYNLICNDILSTSLKFGVKSTSGEGFDTGLIGTNKKGLAIRLYTDDSVLNTGEYVDFTYTGSTVPAIYAVPISDLSSTLDEGEFIGSGILVIEYQ